MATNQTIPGSPKTTGEYLKTLNKIFISLCIGQLLFLGAALYMVQVEKFEAEADDLKNIFFIVGGLAIAGGFLLSSVVFKSQLKRVKQKENLGQKLFGYRAALIICFAMLEGPTFLLILFYLLVGDTIFLIMAGAVLGYFISLKPSAQKAIKDMDLRGDDRYAMENPKSKL